MTERAVDGNLSLEDQLRAIRYHENIAADQLVSYTKSVSPEPSKPQNRATFADLPLGGEVKPLMMVAVPQSQTLAQVVAAHPGKVLIYFGTVYVSGAEQQVATFRDA